MAKFPVESNTPQDRELVEAVNYLLSGPSDNNADRDGIGYFGRAFTTGALRTPATRRPYQTLAVGADGATTIDVYDPGILGDTLKPLEIRAGMYVRGVNIGVAARVDASYVPGSGTVPLTVANVGPVRGYVSFNDYPPTRLYIAPIAISTIDTIDAITFRVNFATPLSAPIFEIGSTPTIAGSTFYNGYYALPGVVESTTTYVTVQKVTLTTGSPVGIGGTISVSNTIKPPVYGVAPPVSTLYQWNGSDCFARVNLTNNTDRVRISAQMNATLTYDVLAANTKVFWTCAINRYKGTTISAETTGATSLQGTGSVTFDKNVAIKSIIYDYATTGTYVEEDQEVIMLNFVDDPGQGSYMYRIDMAWTVINTGGDAEIVYSNLGYRSISADVLKA